MKEHYKNREYRRILQLIANKVSAFRSLDEDCCLTDKGLQLWKCYEFINNLSLESETIAEFRDALERVRTIYMKYPDFKYYGWDMGQEDFEVVQEFIDKYLY